MVLNGAAKTVELTYAGETVEITETAAEFYNDRQKAVLSLSKILDKDKIFGIGNNGEILSVRFGLYRRRGLDCCRRHGHSDRTDCSKLPAAMKTEICIFKTDIPVGAKLYVREIADRRTLCPFG